VEGGQFAPGATAETKGSSEIEIEVTRDPGGAYIELFVFGTADADSIRAGELKRGTGIDLNASGADHDADLTFGSAPESPLIDGVGGADRISMNGGPGFKGPYPRGSIPEGGPGNDHVTGTDFFDDVYADAGHDVIHALGGDDRVFARDGSKDEIFCGSGRDEAKVDGLDRLHSCERARVGKPGR
jgi:Ca2+-binding RTX toxin-like protein